MDCPACHEPMMVLEYDAVEVDFCPQCEGIWLDAGELELLFGDNDACAAFINAGDPARVEGEEPRPCPICGKAMEKAVTAGNKPVVYDRCKDGLWFDKGELAEILDHAVRQKGGEDVAAVLRDMFAAGA